jgi:transposase
MARKKLWAGLDVGVETTSVCIIDESGEVLHECKCQTATKAVRHELTHFRRSRFASVILEAGSGTHLARGLRGLGYPVELYETVKLSKFLRIRRNKTDAGDANGIAEAGRIGQSTVSRVYLKDLDSECLQARLTIRRQLIRQRVATRNMIGRLVEQFGGRLGRSKAEHQLRRNVQAEIKRLFRDEPRALTSELRYLVDQYERLEAHQGDIDRELRREASDNEVCRRFMEIPGVGPICALNFYAAVGDPHRFLRSSDIGSYFGLAPRLHQSGLTYRIGRISKMGNKAVRALLVHAAICFLHFGKSESDLRTWVLDVESRRGKFRSRVALARKLAVVMIAMWKNGTRYNPNHSLTRTD